MDVLILVINRLSFLLIWALIGMGVGYILARYFGVGGPK
jgi:hypothetical protein